MAINLLAMFRSTVDTPADTSLPEVTAFLLSSPEVPADTLFQAVFQALLQVAFQAALQVVFLVPCQVVLQAASQVVSQAASQEVLQAASQEVLQVLSQGAFKLSTPVNLANSKALANLWTKLHKSTQLHLPAMPSVDF